MCELEPCFSNTCIKGFLFASNDEWKSFVESKFAPGLNEYDLNCLKGIVEVLERDDNFLSAKDLKRIIRKIGRKS